MIGKSARTAILAITLAVALGTALVAGLAAMGDADQTIMAEARDTPPAGGTLFDDLTGFASATRGGQGGTDYIVTTLADYDPRDPGQRPIEGSLRYGVEKLITPRHIRFSPAVFKAGDATVTLTRALRPRHGNFTLDGRSDQGRVTLRRVYDWADYRHDKSGEACVIRPDIKSRRYYAVDPGGVIELVEVQNVILTHLRFRQDTTGTPLQGVTDPECMGDQITVFSKRRLKRATAGVLQVMRNGRAEPRQLLTNTRAQSYDLIWINRNEFSECKDGCIDVVAPSPAQPSRLSITRNLFRDTNKTMILGLNSADNLYADLHGNPTRHKLFVSVIGNRFERSQQRAPRISSAVVHFANNLVHDWRYYGTGLAEHAVALIEHNVYWAENTPKSGEDAIYTFPDRQGVSVLARNNHYMGRATRPGLREVDEATIARYFGACWPHCAKIVPLGDQPAADARQAITGNAGR